MAATVELADRLHRIFSRLRRGAYELPIARIPAASREQATVFRKLTRDYDWNEK